jgi:hypothetical protein
LWLRYLLAIPEIAEAIELSEAAAYSEGELDTYQSYWDAVSREKTLINANYRQGEIAGRAQGEKIGEARGRMEGKAEERAAIRQKLIDSGMTPEQASAILGEANAEQPPEK